MLRHQRKNHYNWCLFFTILISTLMSTSGFESNIDSSKSDWSSTSSSNNNSPTKHENIQTSKTNEDGLLSFLSATREENGVKYEYSNRNGVESLKIYGNLPRHFNKEEIINDFRKGLGIKATTSSPSAQKNWHKNGFYFISVYLFYFFFPVSVKI
jgi:hypothetical protein